MTDYELLKILKAKANDIHMKIPEETMKEIAGRFEKLLGYCDDSTCYSCKHLKCWSENPDAENGPGHVDYEECDVGCDENLFSRWGCMNYKEVKYEQKNRF